MLLSFYTRLKSWPGLCLYKSVEEGMAGTWPRSVVFDLYIDISLFHVVSEQSSWIMSIYI